MRAPISHATVAAVLAVVGCGWPALSSAATGPDQPARSDPSLRSLPRASIDAGELRSSLDNLARQAPSASGFQVVEITDDGNRVLFSRRESKPRKLASNMKLFTTATALDRFGAKGRIETTLQRTGRIDLRGTLHGSLYLVGGGDPRFGAVEVRALARSVAVAGIRRVSGDLIGDDTIFDRLRGVPDSGYGPSEYIAPLAGLVYEGSTYAINPAREAAGALQDALRRKGIKLDGRARVGKLPGAAGNGPALGSQVSAPISELIAATNKFSDNFLAEMLAKLVSAADGQQGTTDDGASEIEAFARSLGSAVQARDGSGLTDDNRSSPGDVARLLDAMHSHPDAAAYYASLPVAGREGTLIDRMSGTAADGDCRAKTGTINFVSSLSGYCELGQGGDGDLVAFSILMNGVSSYDAARDIQDRIVIEIARYESR